MARYALVFIVLLLSGVPLAHAATVRTITFPVDGTHNFRDDFAEPRAGGTREHLGIDIVATKMTPVVAAVDGRVSYIAIPQASWGYSVTIRDSEGYSYRYLHINNDTPGTDDGAGGEANAYAPGISRGATVTKGQLLGWVGDSGNAEATVSHLHFEIRTPDRTPINPYESLVASDTKYPGSAGGVAPSPTGSESGVSYIFTRALSRGSTGEDVRQLQAVLQELGHFTYPTLTGYFGPITETAVIAFQKAQGIDPIGIVGPITRGVLNGI